MMDNWTKDFFAFCDAVNEEIESFFVDLEQFTTELPDALEEAVQEIEITLTQDLAEFWQDWEELWALWESDLDWSEEFWETEGDFVVTSKVTPDQNTHPACQGCRHYHGYIYGGNLFVCGMHPYGWDDEHCPDWEKDSDQ